MKNLLFFSLVFQVYAISAQTTPTQADDKMAKLIVHVMDDKKKPQEGEKVLFEALNTKKEYSGVTDATGQFTILVPKGDKYDTKYKNISGTKKNKVLDIPNPDGEVEFDFTIVVSHPKLITLEDVFFDTGKSTLRPESNKALNDLAEYLGNKKSMKIEIGGHTDNVGDATANMKLSQERANSVRNYLIKKGIAGDRVIAKGYGDTMPVADNNTPEGKQKNRRTEVKTISE
jgi:OOP family OmpA-OmpF porin